MKKKLTSAIILILCYSLGVLTPSILDWMGKGAVKVSDGMVEIEVKYTAGNRVNPDNRSEVVFFPAQDGLISWDKVSIRSMQGREPYSPTGGYVWSWNGLHEIRLLTGEGAQQNRYPANGTY